MSIFIDEKTPVLVQGITGRIGSFHTQEMIDYGTNIVAGVTPGKGGTTHLGKPVFNTVEEAEHIYRSRGEYCLCTSSLCC